MEYIRLFKKSCFLVRICLTFFDLISGWFLDSLCDNPHAFQFFPCGCQAFITKYTDALSSSFSMNLS